MERIETRFKRAIFTYSKVVSVLSPLVSQPLLMPSGRIAWTASVYDYEVSVKTSTKFILEKITEIYYC